MIGLRNAIKFDDRCWSVECNNQSNGVMVVGCLQPTFMQQSTHLASPPNLACSPPWKKNKLSWTTFMSGGGRRSWWMAHWPGWLATHLPTMHRWCLSSRNQLASWCSSAAWLNWRINAATSTVHVASKRYIGYLVRYSIITLTNDHRLINARLTSLELPCENWYKKLDSLCYAIRYMIR